MNVKMIPAPVPTSTSELILIDDVPIGKLTPHLDPTSYKYHVVLDSKVADYGNSIYQGFGQTIDEAMCNAIVSGRERRIKELAELDNLENAIWGDHELN